MTLQPSFHIARAGLTFFALTYLLGIWSQGSSVVRADEKTPDTKKATAQKAAGQKASLFETDVQPILSKKCGQCHSENVRKGDLNLASFKGVRKGGESGESLLADSLEDSLLWIMIEGGDMPPEKQPQLTAAEMQIIKRWIVEGGHSQQPVETEDETPHQHNVLPIVHLRCVTCHGAQRQEGGLDLRTPASMRKGGRNGPAFVEGDPAASRMIMRIESEACPPRDKLLKFFVRRPPSSETKVLRDWIEAGAPLADIQADVANREPDPLVTDDERQHWAYQTPQDNLKHRSIDQFIEHELRRLGLKFSPAANRDVLIRRAYIDLIGMPPAPEDWTKWRSDERSNWYATMIDELLDSPHYGERWGRYWLDVAGYADSEGGVSADPLRQVAWKYRDYVIRSFNNDTPYDQFLRQQIAGDELIDHQNAKEITKEIVDNLVATGFLRMGIDQTGSRTMNFVPERLGVINDAIRVLGSGVLGITLECARCHSHKYDPIPQRDYYRFKAIFQGAYDEHDWLTFKNRNLELAPEEQRRRVAVVNGPLKTKVKKLQREVKAAQAALRIAMLRHRYPDQPEKDRKATLFALTIADNNRTLPQRNLVEKLQRAELVPVEDQSQAVQVAHQSLRNLEEEVASTEQQMAPPLRIRALWDRGRPSPTYILIRGEHTKPGRLVGPGVPSVLTDGRTPFEIKPPFPGGAQKTGRRLALANWLTHPDHPLTSRVMVNRIWRHHFGAGLVRSMENFGVKGDRPSHPELLDWIALQFIKRGWSIKAMHRLIMNSRTYQQSSRVDDERKTLDPENRWLSRMPMRRMDAEALRDSLLFVAGKLDPTTGGPPDRVIVDRNGLITGKERPQGGWRRSVYLRYRRTEIPSLMDTFDYPEMGPNCVSRNVSTVSPQSLMLMNNRRVRELSAALAMRVETCCQVENAKQQNGELHGDVNLAARVDHVYRIALSRAPTMQERKLGIAALRKLTSDWRGDLDSAMETYCHAILNSAAFLYVD